MLVLSEAIFCGNVVNEHMQGLHKCIIILYSCVRVSVTRSSVEEKFPAIRYTYSLGISMSEPMRVG